MRKISERHRRQRQQTGKASRNQKVGRSKNILTHRIGCASKQIYESRARLSHIVILLPQIIPDGWIPPRLYRISFHTRLIAEDLAHTRWLGKPNPASAPRHAEPQAEGHHRQGSGEQGPLGGEVGSGHAAAKRERIKQD